MRQRITWTRLAALVHAVQFLLVAFLVEHADGSLWLFAAAAGLACSVTPLLVARSLLTSDRMLGLALLLALVPALAGIAALRSRTEGALVVYALGVTGCSLGLSMLACVLALRASSRPVRLRVGTIGVVASTVAAVGALVLVPMLPLPSGLLLAVPVSWAVVVVAVVAASLEGEYDSRDRAGGPRAAFEAVNAVLLVVGAVALAALASCAVHVDIEVEVPGARVQHAWEVGVGLLRRAAMNGLPILAASALVLGANAVRLGRGARAWGGRSLLIAAVVLALVGGLRFALSRASRAAVNGAHAAKWPTVERSACLFAHRHGGPTICRPSRSGLS